MRIGIVGAGLSGLATAFYVKWARPDAELVVFEANPANSFVDFVGEAAYTLAWFFRDLFDLDDAKLQVVVNYGLAAAVYLGLGRVLARGLGND